MLKTIERFLRYLTVERNSSDLTIKSYREDLTILCDYLEETMGMVPAPGSITPLDLRNYVAALHEAGHIKRVRGGAERAMGYRTAGPGAMPRAASG